MNSQTLILVALLLPFIGALFIFLTKNNINIRETSTLIISAALIYVIYALLPDVLNGIYPELYLFNVTSTLSIHFQVEPLGMLFACIASFLWFINSIYSIGYMRSNQYEHQTRFYIYFSLAIASAIGIAFFNSAILRKC